MKYLRFIIIIIALLPLSNCKNDVEVQPRDYPYVITNSPSVYSEGAQFSADITNLGNHAILKYGFVWGTESNPTIQDSSILLAENASTGIYSCNVISGLADGQTYYVRAYILTTKHEIYGNVKSFVSQGSLPPVINDFEPKYGPIGTKVIIEGENFALSKNSNIVKFGNKEVIVNSISNNKLEVTIPSITEPEKVQVTIETAGMVVASQDSFDLWFPWKRKNDFSEGYIDGFPISFNLNNKGYFGLGYNKTKFWEFDPANDIFTQKAEFPKSLGVFPMSFTVNNRGYVLFVDHFYDWWEPDTINELWEYNPENDIWTRKADFPGSKRRFGVALSINGKGYIIGGKFWNNVGDRYLSDLWEYDPDKDIWTKKADFPDSGRERAFGFSMNGKGYFGLGSANINNYKSIYEYNPESDTWTYFTEFPGYGHVYHTGFIINDKFYMGLGCETRDYCYSDFWEFNITDKSWRVLHSCPINNMTVNLSFGINNKGYIGLGGNSMFEFDPTKN